VVRTEGFGEILDLGNAEALQLLMLSMRCERRNFDGGAFFGASQTLSSRAPWSQFFALLLRTKPVMQNI
jgi:hypothetical protein